MDEIWMPAAGYEGRYEVSSRGSVRSLLSRKGARLLRTFPDRQGYARVALTHPSGTKQVMVHRLVLLAFCGPCTPGCLTRHLDGDCGNNSLENLCWDTPTANNRDTVRHGRHRTCWGSSHALAKLTEDMIPLIISSLAAGEKQSTIAGDLGVSQSLVSRVGSGHTWKHVTAGSS